MIECNSNSVTLDKWMVKGLGDSKEARDLACIPAAEILRVRSRAGRLVSGITVKRYNVIIGFG